jgi:ribosome-binding factor A
LRLKNTPELTFTHDTTPREAAHIEAVLEALSGDQPDADKGKWNDDEDRT